MSDWAENERVKARICQVEQFEFCRRANSKPDYSTPTQTDPPTHTGIHNHQNKTDDGLVVVDGPR
jgi:hypothetical protein